MAGHGKKNKDEPRLLTLVRGAVVEAAARAVGLSGGTKARTGRFEGRYDRVGNETDASSRPHQFT